MRGKEGGRGDRKGKGKGGKGRGQRISLQGLKGIYAPVGK